jgi:hypothetical protein
MHNFYQTVRGIRSRTDELIRSGLDSTNHHILRESKHHMVEQGLLVSYWVSASVGRSYIGEVCVYICHKGSKFPQ